MSPRDLSQLWRGPPGKETPASRAGVEEKNDEARQRYSATAPTFVQQVRP
jgi:hypothetical protein